MRQKLLLFPIIAFFSLFHAQAQIAKGSILVGGNAGYVKASNSSSYDYTDLIISPSLGIAVKENLILGLNFNYGFRDSEGTSNKNRSYGAGIFIRKYKPLGKNFYLFAQGDAGYDYSSNKQNVIISQVPDVHEIKTHSLGLGFSPGISYALTKRLQLEVMFTDVLSVNYMRSKKESVKNQTLLEPKAKSFSVNSNLSLNGINSLGIGVRFLINKSR